VLAGAHQHARHAFETKGRKKNDPLLRSGCATRRRLAKLPEVVAVKDATGGLDCVSAIAAVSDFPILSGDDPLTLPMMSIGGCGVVSVTSNVSPELMGRIVRAAQSGDMAAAKAAHLALVPLFNALFCETNPVPVKHALKAMGLISTAVVRAPLAPIDEASVPKVEAALSGCGLLSA
jgi:4-hydroxy-tetrahydrodipicolinate synthase